MFWLAGKRLIQDTVTSAGSFDNRTKLKGTEANAPETQDTVYHSGHREFLVLKQALSVEACV